MKRYSCLSILMLGISAAAWGSPCTAGTSLSSYISAGSCTFSGSGQTYTLGSFTFLALGVLTDTATPADIDVTATVGANGPTVTFTPDSTLQVNSGLAATATYLFGFDITSNASNIGFSSVTLGEHSALSGLGSLGVVAEEDCYGGALPLPQNVNILSLGSGGLACLGGGPSVGTSLALTPLVNANANASIQFSGFSNSVDVLKEVSLTGVLGGSASVSGISQSFTTQTATTPEPGAFFLGGCGLVLLALVRPRRKLDDEK